MTTSPLNQSISFAEILSALHNHSQMITLNPLVISHVPAPTDNSETSVSTTYSITERISYLPFHLWDSEFTFTASFENTSSGLDTVTHAPAGVDLDSRWKVLSVGALLGRNDHKGCWLEETVKVTCSILLMPYVKSSMKGSHAELRRRLEDVLMSEQGH